MYQVIRVDTGEKQPILSDMPYALSGEYAARKEKQKTDEQGNLLYWKTVEQTVNPPIEQGEEGEPISLALETVQIETTEAYRGYIKETWDDELQDYVEEVIDEPYPPVMIDDGPQYDWVEITQTNAEKLRARKDTELAAIRQQLSGSDYKALKFVDGSLSAEEYEPYKQVRLTLRDKYNRIEAATSQAAITAIVAE
jgi:hypothetical protein